MILGRRFTQMPFLPRNLTPAYCSPWCALIVAALYRKAYPICQRHNGKGAYILEIFGFIFSKSGFRKPRLLRKLFQAQAPVNDPQVFQTVSTDYLLGLTENKNPANAELQALHLRDDAVDAIRDGNSRLKPRSTTRRSFKRSCIVNFASIAASVHKRGNHADLPPLSILLDIRKGAYFFATMYLTRTTEP